MNSDFDGQLKEAESIEGGGWMAAAELVCLPLASRDLVSQAAVTVLMTSARSFVIYWLKAGVVSFFSTSSPFHQAPE